MKLVLELTPCNLLYVYVYVCNASYVQFVATSLSVGLLSCLRNDQVQHVDNHIKLAGAQNICTARFYF